MDAKTQDLELGMVCPKCARVCRAEIVHNGPNVVGLANCCGWAFDGWPDTPIPAEPREPWVRDAHQYVTELFHDVAKINSDFANAPVSNGPESGPRRQSTDRAP